MAVGSAPAALADAGFVGTLFSAVIHPGHGDFIARLAARLQAWWPVTQRQVLTQWTDAPGVWK